MFARLIACYYCTLFISLCMVEYIRFFNEMYFWIRLQHHIINTASSSIPTMSILSTTLHLPSTFTIFMTEVWAVHKDIVYFKALHCLAISSRSVRLLASDCEFSTNRFIWSLGFHEYMEGITKEITLILNPTV